MPVTGHCWCDDDSSPVCNHECGSLRERDEARAEARRLREAIREALRWHVYSVPADDPDGNKARIDIVGSILRGALDG